MILLKYWNRYLRKTINVWNFKININEISQKNRNNSLKLTHIIIWGRGIDSAPAKFDLRGACTVRPPFKRNNSSYIDASVTSHWKPVHDWNFFQHYWFIILTKYQISYFYFLYGPSYKKPKIDFYVTHSLIKILNYFRWF